MNPDGTFRVVRLLAENFKKLQAIDITPNQFTTEIRGRNGAGKTSVLDAISAALGGKKAMPEMPLRSGSEDGQILCILADDESGEKLLVKRTFRADGKTTLEITAEGGFVAPTPQKILDRLVSEVTFDPTAFVRMDDGKQLETLRQLVGVDFTELDQKYKVLYAERTTANRLAKERAAQAAGIVVPGDTPAEEVSLADLTAQQRELQAQNASNQAERGKLQMLIRDVDLADDEVRRDEKAVAELERRLDAQRLELLAARDRQTQAHAARDAQQAAIASLQDADMGSIGQRIVDAGNVNRNVARSQQRAGLLEEAETQQALSKDLTSRLDAIDSEKAGKLSGVQWPVPGLGFGSNGAGGVTYNGLPFKQASGAEQLRVSVAIGAALAPHLKVILCRDASLLDDTQLAVITQFAADHRIQVWLEIVDSQGGPGKIVIEEGLVVSGGTPAEAPPVEAKKRGRKAKPEVAAVAAAPAPESAPPAASAAPPWETPTNINGQETFGF